MLHKSKVLPHAKETGCYCGGIVNWRTALVHYAAKIAGLHVKVEGMPLGTNRNLDWSSCDDGSIRSDSGIQA